MARWYANKLANNSKLNQGIKKLEKDLSKEDIGFTKKEILKLEKEKDKLNRSLGGISNMNKIPEMIFVIDTNVGSLAIKEAIKLKIPIVAVLNSASDPTGINYPIPSTMMLRSIDLYCELLKSTIIDARKTSLQTK